MYYVVKATNQAIVCLFSARHSKKLLPCLMTDTLRRGVGTATAAEAARLNARAEDNEDPRRDVLESEANISISSVR